MTFVCQWSSQWFLQSQYLHHVRMQAEPVVVHKRTCVQRSALWETVIQVENRICLGEKPLDARCFVRKEIISSIWSNFSLTLWRASLPYSLMLRAQDALNIHLWPFRIALLRSIISAVLGLLRSLLHLLLGLLRDGRVNWAGRGRPNRR